MIDLLDMTEVRIVALLALANLGPATIPAIPKLREDADAFVRIGATFVLPRTGPKATELLAPCKEDPSFPIVNLATDTLAHWEKVE